MKSHQSEGSSRSLFSSRKRILLILGLALAIVGYFGPWVDHKTAALVLTGQDMGEFVKFLPEVRAGTAPMIREFFYLPPFAAALGLILLMASKRLPIRWWSELSCCWPSWAWPGPCCPQSGHPNC